MLLSKMKSWSCPANWSRNLHNLIFRFNMTLPVKMVHYDLPVKWKNQHVMMPWPTLPFRSWLDCVFKKTHGQPILGGNLLRDQDAWKTMLRDYWGKFRVVKGHHNVFQDHLHELDCCVPVMVHGDEGRGKLRRAVSVTSLQPALVPDGHAGHSFNSRFLHSIMPGELYVGDCTMSILQEALVEELRSLYTEGFEVPGRHFKHMFLS